MTRIGRVRLPESSTSRSVHGHGNTPTQGNRRMSSFDPATVRQVVAEFTPRRPQRFQDLAPAREVIGSKQGPSPELCGGDASRPQRVKSAGHCMAESDSSRILRIGSTLTRRSSSSFPPPPRPSLLGFHHAHLSLREQNNMADGFRVLETPTLTTLPVELLPECYES